MRSSVLLESRLESRQESSMRDTGNPPIPATWDDWREWLFRSAGAIAGMVRNQPLMAIHPMSKQIVHGCAHDLIEYWRGRETLPGWSELPPGELARRLSAELSDDGIRFDDAAAAILDANLDDAEACAHRLLAHLLRRPPS
jgi:hypothetical protein